MTIDPIKNTLSHVHDNLIYRITFMPLKPFSAIVELQVTRKSGGRWNFKVKL